MVDLSIILLLDIKSLRIDFSTLKLMPLRSKHGGSPADKSCCLCGEKDSSQDPVDPECYIIWANTVKGSNVGRICYYCSRVYRQTYNGAYSSVSALDKHLQGHSDDHAQFMVERIRVLNECKAQFRPRCAD